jgi:hypothetical protein
VNQQVAKVEVTPKVVRPGGAFTIQVSSYDGPRGFANIQADCVFVELARDRFSFATAKQVELDEEFTLTIDVPCGARDGPHFLAALRVSHEEESAAPVTQGNLLDRAFDLQTLGFVVGDKELSAHRV